MIKVIVDTREQKGMWTFAASQEIEVIHRKLDTGDYSIEGLENKLCIERKKTVAELAGNITDPRFTRELERMYNILHSFILLEFDYDDIDGYPQNSNLPLFRQKQVRITNSFIMKRLSEIQIKYGIHIVPCGNAFYAEYVAINLIKRTNELYS